MELPNLFRKVAYLPKRDATQYLEVFTREGRWKENARVLDVGCGDGSTLVTVLERFAPSSCKSIVGSDISVKMIEYAKENYENERFKFVQWDVAEEPPLQMINSFDHVFSFFALHWVKAQRVAFENIYKSLSEGGNCMVMFLGRHTVYGVYRALSCTPKWADDLKNVEIFISPYCDSEDPKTEVTDLMQSVGFKDVQVTVEEKSHRYESEEVFKGLMKSLSPFNALHEKWDDFMQDYFEVSSSGPYVEYTLIVAYGSK